MTSHVLPTFPGTAPYKSVLHQGFYETILVVNLSYLLSTWRHIFQQNKIQHFSRNSDKKVMKYSVKLIWAFPSKRYINTVYCLQYCCNTNLWRMKMTQTFIVLFLLKHVRLVKTVCSDFQKRFCVISRRTFCVTFWYARESLVWLPLTQTVYIRYDLKCIYNVSYTLKTWEYTVKIDGLNIDHHTPSSALLGNAISVCFNL